MPVCKRTRRNGGSTDVVRPLVTGSDQTDEYGIGRTGPKDVVSLAGMTEKTPTLFYRLVTYCTDCLYSPVNSSVVCFTVTFRLHGEKSCAISN